MASRQHFHGRLEALAAEIVTLGREVAAALPQATEAWLQRDSEAGERVDGRSAGWSRRAAAVEVAASELIATQQPVGADLRALVSLIRLTEEVARSGGLVAHVARSACFEREADAYPDDLRRVVARMSTIAVTLLSQALRAYEAGDSKAVEVVDQADDELDLLRLELFSRLRDGQVPAATAIDLALLARFYERLGDHAVTIAHQAHFVVTGRLLPS